MHTRCNPWRDSTMEFLENMTPLQNGERLPFEISTTAVILECCSMEAYEKQHETIFHLFQATPDNNYVCSMAWGTRGGTPRLRNIRNACPKQNVSLLPPPASPLSPYLSQDGLPCLLLHRCCGLSTLRYYTWPQKYDRHDEMWTRTCCVRVRLGRRVGVSAGKWGGTKLCRQLMLPHIPHDRGGSAKGAAQHSK